MHGFELKFSDGEGFAKAGNTLVGHTLLKVVDSDQEVRIARL